MTSKLMGSSAWGWREVTDGTEESKIKRAAIYNDITVEQALEKIDIERLQYGTGLRYEPLYIMSKKLYDAVRAKKAAADAKIKYIKCDCGCTIPESLVMNSSRGTSCCDCYDRMSD